MRQRCNNALTAIALTALLQPMTVAQSSSTMELIGLTTDNTLVSFDLNRSAAARSIPVTNLEGTLIGIDVRPANQMLYGVTDTGKIYTINPKNGMATMVSRLNTDFTAGQRSGVDFNPVADRLRLVGSNGQNFRVNVETGEATVDKPLAYATDDSNVKQKANISAGAYTNSVMGSKSTQLFNIDSNLDILVLQNPPNDGVLKTVGTLGVNFEPMAGMEIVADAQGNNTAYAVSNSMLYKIDLSKGTAMKMNPVSVKNRSMTLIDIAAVSLP